MTGMVAPMVLGGPINGDWFEAYVADEGEYTYPVLEIKNMVNCD